MIESISGAPQNIFGKAACACLVAGPAVALVGFCASLFSADFRSQGIWGLVTSLLGASLGVSAISFVLVSVLVVPLLTLLRRMNLAGPISVYVVATFASIAILGSGGGFAAPLVIPVFVGVFAWVFNRLTESDES